MVSSSLDKTAKIWDVHNGNCVASLRLSRFLLAPMDTRPWPSLIAPELLGTG